ncbi:hypothetical protein ACWIVY_02725 [Ursidibacter sp. B-7004-1]
MKFNKFKQIKSHNATHNQKIGISYNEHSICCCINQNKHSLAIWKNVCTSYSVIEQIDEVIKQAVDLSSKFTIVVPIPNHYIWQKTVYFPTHFNSQEQYKQVIQILKQALPIPVSQIYFDVKSHQEENHNRIKTTIYALRKSYADPFLSKPNMILDNELFCYLRGVLFLNNSELQTESINQIHNIDIDKLSFPENTLDKKLYLIALGASLWNGKASI